MRWNGVDHETAYWISLDLPRKLHLNAIYALGKAPSDTYYVVHEKKFEKRWIFFPDRKNGNLIQGPS
jgi:hypothetical protein